MRIIARDWGGGRRAVPYRGLKSPGGCLYQRRSALADIEHGDLQRAIGQAEVVAPGYHGHEGQAGLGGSA